jgi:Tfp pilus assembly protein PilN
MVQQINLCVTAFKAEKQQLAARTMVPLLGVCVAVGAVLAAAWLWNLQRSADSYRQTLDTQGGEIQSLQAAIQRSRAAAGPLEPAMLQQFQDKRIAMQQRERVLEVLLQGALRPGEGHSDRMALVASSIPATVWVTGVQVDSGRFEVSGFTVETAALNGWVGQLGAHPLMRGLKLSNVRVESVSQPGRPAGAAAALVPSGIPASNGKPLWSFTLVNLEPALSLARPAGVASQAQSAAQAYVRNNAAQP